jgi:hypothetical protein
MGGASSKEANDLSDGNDTSAATTRGFSSCTPFS